MIDTFNFTLPNTFYGYDHIKQIFEKKMLFKSHNKYLRGTALVVNHKNYKFILTEKQLRAEGSLTKLFLGNNVKNMTYHQVQNALMQFETLFEIPFDEARITRVDYGPSMMMNYPPKMYLDILQTPYGYEPDIRRTSKLFEHYSHSLYIYDKVDELENNKDERVVHEQFKNAHIIRYEHRFTSYLKKVLGLNNLSFKNFFETKVYETMNNKWFEAYKNIPKLTTIPSTELKLTTYREFINSLNYAGIMVHNGVDGILSQINGAKIDKSERFRIKKYLKTIPKLEPFSPKLQNELDSKITDFYNSVKLQLIEIN